MTAAPSKPPALPSGLRWFLWVNATLTFVCLGIEAFCAHLAWPEVYRTPFFIGIRFFDLEDYLGRFQALHTAAFFAPPDFSLFTYPAAAVALSAPFYALGPALTLNVFLGVCAALVVALLALFARALHRRGLPLGTALQTTLYALVLAFPLWFCLQRANLELLVFLLLAAGLWGFCSGRSALAMTCFALAGTIKITPILWLALFVRRRQWGHLAGGLALAAAINAAATAWVGPTYRQAAAGLARGLVQFNYDYVQHPRVEALGFDHSLIGIARLWAWRQLAAGEIVRPYLIVAGILGALLFIIRIRHLPLINQVLCLAAAALVLPPNSFDYKLLHLYLGFGLLAFAALDGVRETTPFLVLLGVVTAPLSEFIHHGVRFGGQLKALVLLSILILAMVKLVPSRFDTHPAP